MLPTPPCSLVKFDELNVVAIIITSEELQMDQDTILKYVYVYTTIQEVINFISYSRSEEK